MIEPTPAQKADACTSAEECDGFIAQADAILADPSADQGYWKAIRAEGIRRRIELDRSKRRSR